MGQPTKKNSDDRFSRLPDEIVHHILARLPMRTLAQLSTLSKRCRELCISNPTLIFSSDDTSSVGSSRRGFCNFLDRLMALRCLYKVKTKRFHLDWFFETTSDDEEYQVRTWLQHAVNSGVEEFHLEIDHPIKSFSLPPSILGCKNIMSLEINAKDLPFRLPSPLLVPSFADKLQILVFEGLKTNNESLGEWFSSFKSLKVLKLLYVWGIKTMTITNSSVESLVIASRDDDLQKIDIQKLQKLNLLVIDWMSVSSGSKSMKISTPNLRSLCITWEANNSRGTSLEISAPNLQTFWWFGTIPEDYCMKNSPNLLYASVGLLPPIESMANHASTMHSLEKVLHSIQRAKNLTLWDDFVQVLYRHGCLPFSFGNVGQLAIRETSSSAPIEPLSSLLKGTTNLKHLILIIGSSSSVKLSSKMKYQQSQNDMFPCHLKTVAVKLFNGENEVELIKYAFKNAEESEMVVVLYTSPISQGFITEFRGFKFCPKKLHSYLKSLESVMTTLH